MATSATTAENTPVSIDVLAEDSDPDGDIVSVVGFTDPTSGTAVLGSGGVITYTPGVDFHGSDSFTYSITNGWQVASAGVSVTVVHVDQPPVAEDGLYVVAEDSSLTISAAAGVLANDADVDSLPMAAGLVSNVSHGTLALSSSGSFTYSPSAGFTGTDSFTYVATVAADTIESNIATVTITVSLVNFAPVALGDAYTTNENTPLTVAAGSGVLANDTQANGYTLFAELVTGPLNGTLALDANGSFVYTPDLDFNGGDSFTYQAVDDSNSSNIATVTLTVTHVDQAPVANPDFYAVGENESLSVTTPGVLANDSDVDSLALTAVLVSGVTQGALVLNSNGSFSYTPVTGFFGTDSFSYRAHAGALNSVATSVTITVVEQPPIANPDSFAVSEDAVLAVSAPGVLGNDADVNSVGLQAVQLTSVSNGVLVFSTNGSLTYTPNLGFEGTDSFSYQDVAGGLTSLPATVTFTVGPPVTLFATQVSFNTGSTPLSVAVGDFNGDGKPDLAVANDGDNSVSILLNQTTTGSTTPSFSAVLPALTAGSLPVAIAVGDFNGDGKPDLAVVNSGDNSVSIFTNTTATGATSTTFTTLVLTTGAFPSGVAIGDLNGDGKPDLVVTNQGSNNVSVYLNTTPTGAATPSFSAQVLLAAGDPQVSVAFGDFNGDGKPDLAVVANGLVVFLNTTAAGATTPTFASPASLSAGANAFGIAVGDFNADGKLDVAITNITDNTVSIFTNTTVGAGPATFTSLVPAPGTGAGTNPYGLAAGKFQERLDLVAADNSVSTIAVLVNTTTSATPSFATAIPFSAGSNTNPRGIAVDDFNGDGKPDVVITNQDGNVPPGTVSVFLGQ